MSGATVTANYLTVLGVRPELGRDFNAQEDTPGGPKAVLISESLWRRRFNANPKVVGSELTVDGLAYEVIGVVPPEVQFPRQAEMFTTVGDLRQSKNLLERDNHVGFTGVGRLKPGVSVAQADQDLNRIARELTRRYPASNTGRTVSINSLLNYTVGDYRQSLYLLLGAVGCVLLIACANVANLQLARASGREKELAVRTALGASRWRLVRQMMTESALLGLLGGAGAVLLSLWAMDAIVALSPASASRFQQTHLDAPVLAFTVALALVTGIVVGVWPAWRVSGAAAMARALHEGSARGGTGGAGQQRTRALLVVAQVALAVVLLAGAGVMLRSFWRVQSEPLGFQPAGLLTLSVALPDIRYRNEKGHLFFNELLERVRALPGVAAAATVVNAPFGDSNWTSSLHLTGMPDDVRAKALLEDIGGVTVRGYRAPSFSINGDNLWALDCIRDAGYRYSSSIYPVRHDHYGMPDAPRFCYAALPDLLEVPPTTVELFSRNWPAGGGGYFRLLPYALSRWLLQRVNRVDGESCMFYFHPWEVDPAQPRVPGIDARTRFRHYVNLERMHARLDRLLQDFRWDRVDRVFLHDARAA